MLIFQTLESFLQNIRNFDRSALNPSFALSFLHAFLHLGYNWENLEAETAAKVSAITKTGRTEKCCTCRDF